MDTQAEINQLKEEVAQLKEQLRELCSFFEIEPVKDRPGVKTLLIDCGGISIHNPDNPNFMQAHICGSEDGPSLTLWGKAGPTCLLSNTPQNCGSIRLSSAEGKQIVELGLDAKNNPHVGVFYEGKPRAAIKGTAERGAVCAVHDDGTVRAFLSSEFDHGEMMIVGGDMQAAVKLSGNGHDGGGYLGINHPSGKPALVLTTTHLGGGIVSTDNHGEVLAVWPGTESGEDDNS